MIRGIDDNKVDDNELMYTQPSMTLPSDAMISQWKLSLEGGETNLRCGHEVITVVLHTHYNREICRTEKKFIDMDFTSLSIHCFRDQILSKYMLLSVIMDNILELVNICDIFTL